MFALEHREDRKSPDKAVLTPRALVAITNLRFENSISENFCLRIKCIEIPS